MSSKKKEVSTFNKILEKIEKKIRYSSLTIGHSRGGGGLIL
ncbi:hypothetical protein [Blattabacterium cuenoti]|nr:hypothetical protein [Blattabacterium cuenoti]